MIAELLVTNIGRLVTPAGTGALRGDQMQALQIIPDAAIAIAGGRVIWCGARRAWTGSNAMEIDAGGKAVLPGLVDPHTHAVWGGERLDDFDARTSGVTYEQILARGGGIRHTVACTAASSDSDLLAASVTRIQRMIRGGATTIEIKSGYGFDWAVEQRQLAVVRALRAAVPASLLATMLFHLPPVHPGERAAYIAAAVNEWIPRIGREQLASAIDVFIEREAFSLADADALLAAARTAGLACKVHADQFTAMGGAELAIRHGALSVDHLEASGVAQIAALAASETIATVLPGVTLHLGLPAAPARALIDAGAAVAIGSDCNPGSSPLFSMSLAMALAVRLNGLRAAEALIASTANAGAALGLADVGRIAPGVRADLLMLESADWRDLPYTLGDGAIARVFIGGREVTA